MNPPFTILRNVRKPAIHKYESLPKTDIKTYTIYRIRNIDMEQYPYTYIG